VAAKPAGDKKNEELKRSGGGHGRRTIAHPLARAAWPKSRAIHFWDTTGAGLRAEQIRQKLGLAANEMPRVLKQGLSTKTIKAKGQKRSTTYTAV